MPAATRTTASSTKPPANKAAGRETAADLRAALAITLPDQFGLTLKQTATALDRSVSWVAKTRARALADPEHAAPKTSHGGRRNQVLPAEEEDGFMEDVCRVYIKIHRDWRRGLVRGSAAYAATRVRFEEHVRSLLQERYGRRVSRATAYNLMARVGKTKFPDYIPWKWHQYCENKFYS